MKFDITNNNLESYSDSCLVTGIFEESHLFPSTHYINTISQGYISSLLQKNLLIGSIGTQLLLYDAPYFLNKQILLIGCGKKDKFNIDNYRKIIYKLVEYCKNEPITKLVLLFNELEIKNYNNYWKIRHTVSLFNQEIYTFNKFKTNTNRSPYMLNEVSIHINNVDELKNCEQAISDGYIISKGVSIAKDLGNMPPNYCTPIYLSNKVKKLDKKFNNLHIEILDELTIKKLGMNSYLSVGKGSNYSSTMPIIKYLPHPKKALNINPIVLIGKGLTFDSGGISIKPSDNMDEMKYDMCGAAAVYAIMCIVAELNLPINIIGILAISENMISDQSLRPGDIITTLSGQTIEILNTDAEGRLVLCDVLTYVKKYNPSIVIDVATLTGACVTALGHHFHGLMTNNDDLATDLIFASKQTTDYVWRLPLHEKFEQQLQSTCADMTNVGHKYGGGGAITAACFLKKFINDQYSWAHLDIAGTAWISNYRDKSSTGRPVELLSQFLINQSIIVSSNKNSN